MTKENIIDILKALATKRPTFTSEADFQFSLAWEIQKQLTNSKVILEYPVLQGGATIYIDIVVVMDEKKYPIELKYKTKELKNVKIYDTIVNLKNQAAQDLGRYAYLKDISRIENLQKTMGFSTGYAIMITNDNSYVTDKPNTKNCIDNDFRINHGKTINGELSWNLTDNSMESHWTSKYPSITIDGTYTMAWDLYSDKNDKFNLLINQLLPS